MRGSGPPFWTGELTSSEKAGQCSGSESVSGLESSDQCSGAGDNRLPDLTAWMTPWTDLTPWTSLQVCACLNSPTLPAKVAGGIGGWPRGSTIMGAIPSDNRHDRNQLAGVERRRALARWLFAT
jgi:hypothetical protein